MSIGFTELMIVAFVVVLFFGRGKLSELMGDVGKGIRSFKKGLAEDDAAELEHKPADAAAPGSGASTSPDGRVQAAASLER